MFFKTSLSFEALFYLVPAPEQNIQEGFTKYEAHIYIKGILSSGNSMGFLCFVGYKFLMAFTL